MWSQQWPHSHLHVFWTKRKKTSMKNTNRLQSERPGIEPATQWWWCCTDRPLTRLYIHHMVLKISQSVRKVFSIGQFESLPVLKTIISHRLWTQSETLTSLRLLLMVLFFIVFNSFHVLSTLEMGPNAASEPCSISLTLVTRVIGLGAYVNTPVRSPLQ